LIFLYIKWLAFAKAISPVTKPDSSPEHFGIHLVNVETTEERVLPDPSPDCVHTRQPAFSPDGKYLAAACVLISGGVAKIYVQTPDGKHAREVAGATSSEGFTGIAWAADSQSLLYSSDLHLWRVPLAGGKPEKLLFAQDVASPAVARTGNRLAYAQVSNSSGIWRLELGSQAQPAGPATKLISSSRGDRDPHISPDGKYIAFLSGRSGSSEVWVCDRDASNPVQLTFFGGSRIGRTSWSPDSRRIVFDLRASGNAELYIVNGDGGPPRRLPTGTTNASNPFWSGDGHWIYFNTERPESIWKASVEGGAAVRLTGEGGDWPQESVDRTRVLFRKSQGGHIQVWFCVRQWWRRTPRHGNDEPRVGARAERHLLHRWLPAALFPGLLRLCYLACPQDRGPAWLVHRLGAHPLARRPYCSLHWKGALRVGHISGGGVPLSRSGRPSDYKLQARPYRRVQLVARRAKSRYTAQQLGSDVVSLQEAKP